MFWMDFSILKSSILSGIDSMYIQFYSAIEVYLPKFIWALLIIALWIIVSVLTYKIIIYLFRKFKIIELIDRLFISMRKEELKLKDDEDDENEEDKTKSSWILSKIQSKKEKDEVKIAKISDEIKIDEICWKAIAYYLFLIFFRYAIVFIWIKEIENFLAELIAYLPNLFIAMIIAFFWIRFGNFVYDVVFHALDLTKQKTAKVIASGARIIVFFFTLMAVLSKIWIATMITNTILIWFISMLAIAWWLAFWLWWRDLANEILESFKK